MNLFGFTGTALLVAGGVSYTLGAAFYSLKMCGLCMVLAFVRHACSDPHVFFCSLYT